MSKLSDFSAYEKMANMKNMLGGSFIEFLKPNIKTKQNDSVLKMLEIAKDKPDTYLELLAVAIFHKNFEIIKYMVEKFNITEADVPPMNALSFHNSIFPDNSPNILKDVKDNYNEVNCPFVIMSGIGGDINIFNYLLDHKLFSDKTQTGAIGLSKKLKNIINSNVIGACAYYGKNELLKHLLSNFKNEFDINFASSERKSKIGRVGFSKEYTGYTPCMLAIVGPCEDKQTIEVLKILKAYNAAFNKEVFNKDNLLHLCVKSKKIETAKYLIEELKLVDLIDETNKDGHTPLSLSQNLNYAEFISYFGKDNEKDEKEIEQAVQDLINESDQKNKGNSKRSKKNKKKNNDLPALLNVSEEYQETLKVGKNQTSSGRNTYSSNTYSSTNNREKLHALFDSQKPKKKKKEVKAEKEEKKVEEEPKEEIVKEDEKETKEEEKEEEKEVPKEHRKSKKVQSIETQGDEFIIGLNTKKNKKNKKKKEENNNINKEKEKEKEEEEKKRKEEEERKIEEDKRKKEEEEERRRKEEEEEEERRRKEEEEENRRREEEEERRREEEEKRKREEEEKRRLEEEEEERRRKEEEEERKREEEEEKRKKLEEEEKRKKLKEEEERKKEEEKKNKKGENEEEEEEESGEEDFLGEKNEDKKEKNNINQKMSGKEFDDLSKKNMELERKITSLEKEKEELAQCLKKLYLLNKSNSKIPISSNNEENINDLMFLANKELENKDNIIHDLEDKVSKYDLANIKNFSKEKLKEYKDFYSKNLNIINEAMKQY